MLLANPLVGVGFLKGPKPLPNPTNPLRKFSKQTIHIALANPYASSPILPRQQSKIQIKYPNKIPLSKP